MNPTTLALFGRLPREVSLPTRWVINSIAEMQKFIDYNNGIANLFTSVYPSNYVIDKIFFDFDYGPDVLGDAKKLYSWVLDKGYGAIPIVSGKKGYHIYVIFKPKIYGVQAKIFLTKATYSIIKSVFGSFKKELYTEPTGKQVQVLRVKDRIIGVDPAVCGDIRRVCRIPNTLRPPENLNYCTYLPPNKFLEMTESDIVAHMKSKHNYNYEINFKEAPYLTDFEYDFSNEKEFKEWEPMTMNSVIATSNPSLFLEQLLRPCLYRNLATIHPSHEVRVAATVDLFIAGYNAEEILDLYSTLGWEDFEEGLCLEQIESCKKYKPYSCTKLRSYGIPQVCCIG